MTPSCIRSISQTISCLGAQIQGIWPIVKLTGEVPGSITFMVSWDLPKADSVIHKTKRLVSCARVLLVFPHIGIFTHDKSQNLRPDSWEVGGSLDSVLIPTVISTFGIGAFSSQLVSHHTQSCRTRKYRPVGQFLASPPVSYESIQIQSCEGSYWGR
jgi:hypothetical protein